MKRAILLVDHGSRRPEANHLLEEIAEQVRQRLPDCLVVAAHMEFAKPSIADGIDRCVSAGSTEIVVHPYFLSPGQHTTHDIPAHVKAAADRHANARILISEPLGLHAGLIDAILDRVNDASEA